MYNDCLRLSYFPLQWKIGKVIAIPKPGKDPTIPKNYRPISLLSNMGKVFEKLILDKLKSFEEAEKLFIPSQFGFRNSHSTTHQVVRMAEKITMNYNLHRSTGVLALDVEKAFDTVWGDGLIHKIIVWIPALSHEINSILLFKPSVFRWVSGCHFSHLQRSCRSAARLHSYTILVQRLRG